LYLWQPRQNVEVDGLGNAATANQSEFANRVGHGKFQRRKTKNQSKLAGLNHWHPSQLGFNNLFAKAHHVVEMGVGKLAITTRET